MPSETPARKSASTGQSLKVALSDVLAVMRENPEVFPRSVTRTRISISTASGERLDLELDSAGPSDEVPPLLEDPAHRSEIRLWRAERLFNGIADLDLGASAKAAAEALLKQFPADVKFTSGRRSIPEQASAMAPNVVKNLKWIEQTYKDTPQRAALQKWVDDHPAATTAAAIATGLKGVMQAWTEAQKRNFSRHISGDAFDVQPVAGEVGKKIKEAIGKLPKLNWHTFSEGGLEIWHAQFDA
jgi:hypothetical protein